MKKILFFMFLGASVLCPAALKTAAIDTVRLRTDGSSAALTPADTAAIEGFWEHALNTMQLTADPAEVVEIRQQILSQKSTQPLSSYAAAFVAAAEKYLPVAFDNVSRVADADKQRLLQQNLMILIAQMESPKLAPIAIARIDHRGPVVRYWAVKAVTSAGMVRALSDVILADDEIKTVILDALKTRLTFEQQPEIQTMIVQFAAAMDHATAREILLTVADQRIEACRIWSPVRPMLDAKLLTALGSTAMIQSDADVKRTFARKFAELYALFFQRYELGQEALSDDELERTGSVIAEVDSAVLAKMLNVSQTGVVRALQQKRGLDREYEAIFGDRMRAGDLATLFQFDYGKDAAGKAITEPPTLSPPPASITGGQD